MASHAKVEASESVTRQAVAAALEHNGFGTIIIHNGFYDWLEDVLIRLVIDTITEREVDGVMFALSYTDISELTSTGKVFTVLVEGDGHNAIGSVKSFFDAIAVVDIYVDIQDTLLVSEQL